MAFSCSIWELQASTSGALLIQHARLPYSNIELDMGKYKQHSSLKISNVGG